MQSKNIYRKYVDYSVKFLVGVRTAILYELACFPINNMNDKL